MYIFEKFGRSGVPGKPEFWPSKSQNSKRADSKFGQHFEIWKTRNLEFWYNFLAWPCSRGFPYSFGCSELMAQLYALVRKPNSGEVGRGQQDYFLTACRLRSWWNSKNRKVVYTSGSICSEVSNYEACLISNTRPRVHNKNAALLFLASFAAHVTLAAWASSQ